ncbi:MAG: GTPase Era [Gammaproteobacteria bacterium]|nr:GTPase Era [Gammaproteobacteria bacterium]
MSLANPVSRCGMVAIVGRPNVGKSTFLNRVIGQKVSITSRKAQTTRYQILGIKTEGVHQIVFVDTPGLHRGRKGALDRALNREAIKAIAQVDIILFMVEALRWTEDDQYVLNCIKPVACPVLVAVNKVDTVADKSHLLPYLSEVSGFMDLAEIVPLSSSTGDNIAALEEALKSRLPEGPAIFPTDELTDRGERFFAAELIREQLLRRLGAEVPHRLTVMIDEFVSKPHITCIDATIWVERPGQKRIVVGAHGAVLKAAGQHARLEMERLFGSRVFLRTWVKVKERWSDDIRALGQLGFHD